MVLSNLDGSWGCKSDVTYTPIGAASAAILGSSIMWRQPWLWGPKQHADVLKVMCPFSLPQKQSASSFLSTVLYSAVYCHSCFAGVSADSCGKAGDARIFHRSSHASRLTGSVGSNRSAVLLVVSLWLLPNPDGLWSHSRATSLSIPFLCLQLHCVCGKDGESLRVRAEFDLQRMKKICSVCASERPRKSRWLSDGTKVPEGNLLCKCQHQLQSLHLPVSAGKVVHEGGPYLLLSVKSFVVWGSFPLRRVFDWCSVYVWGAMNSHCWVYATEFFLLSLSFLFSLYFLFLPGNFSCNATSPNLICSSSPGYC